MKRSEIKEMPEYYDRYINLCEDVSVTDALAMYGMPLFEKEKQALLQLGDSVYAPGKWTVKDVVQHIIDTERVFAYRAMRISRGDTTPLPGFDENVYAEHTTASNRSLEDLLEEFDTVRKSTILLYKHSTDAMLQNKGTASGKTISPLAIGFTIAGHGIHHMNVLKERYYPLIK